MAKGFGGELVSLGQDIFCAHTKFKSLAIGIAIGVVIGIILSKTVFSSNE